MANLLVEAGNTALKAAWAEGTTLGKTFRYQGEKMMDYLLSLLDKERPEVLTVASALGVTPEEEALLRPRCGHLLILDRSHTDLLLRQNFPEYLSYDRAAELVAAAFLFRGKPVTVFDFGTCNLFCQEDEKLDICSLQPGFDGPGFDNRRLC